MSDDEFAGVDGTPGSGILNGTDRDKRAPRFSWTPAYEATFFRSLCESVQLGLRENHSFKADAWDRAATALREKHGAYPTKSHLVNKSDNARKKFRLWRGLREDPEFLYNPATRTVTASEDAWRAHIEKEPLSRALRGRPFEHEEFMEILYPDVVGSGGAPKRIMKPKRKGPDVIQGSDDSEMPGTAVLDLHVDSPYRPPSQHSRSSVSQPSAAPSQHSTGTTQQRPTSTAIPPRSHLTGISALTPPEETATQGRKRFPTHGSSAVLAADPKGPSPTMAPPPSLPGPAQPEKRRRISSYPNTQNTSNTSGSDSIATSTVAASKQLLEDGLLKIADALRARSPPRWPEQAMDIFFRDFADEDMDLQLKIAEKALADENKAMVFCKMPTALRKHWVKRLREVHNRAT